MQARERCLFPLFVGMESEVVQDESLDVRGGWKEDCISYRDWHVVGIMQLPSAWSVSKPGSKCVQVHRYPLAHLAPLVGTNCTL